MSAIQGRLPPQPTLQGGRTTFVRVLVPHAQQQGAEGQRHADCAPEQPAVQGANHPCTSWSHPTRTGVLALISHAFRVCVFTCKVLSLVRVSFSPQRGTNASASPVLRRKSRPACIRGWRRARCSPGCARDADLLLLRPIKNRWFLVHTSHYPKRGQ